MVEDSNLPVGIQLPGSLYRTDKIMKTIRPLIHILFLFAYTLPPVPCANAVDIEWEKTIDSDSIDALCHTETYLYSGSFDGHIKRISKGAVEEIGAHGDWVRALLCVDDNLISASNDEYIIIWNDGHIVNKIHAHDWWITDIAFYRNTIISVSLDETVKIWGYPDLKLLYQHKIYGSCKHQCVAIGRNKAFIGSTRGVSVLNLKTRQWIYQNKAFDKENVFLSAVAFNNDVYMGDNQGIIYRFDASTANLTATKQVSDMAIKALACRSGVLFAGDDGGAIRSLDVEFQKKVTLLIHFPEPVRAIVTRGNTLFIGCDGGILRAIKVP